MKLEHFVTPVKQRLKKTKISPVFTKYVMGKQFVEKTVIEPFAITWTTKTYFEFKIRKTNGCIQMESYKCNFEFIYLIFSSENGLFPKFWP